MREWIDGAGMGAEKGQTGRIGKKWGRIQVMKTCEIEKRIKRRENRSKGKGKREREKKI